MKKYNLLFWFFVGQFILTGILQAQWLQSNLNAGIGRSLYSDGTTIYAATAQGVYYTNDIGDPWFSVGPQNEDIYSIVKAGNKIIAGSGMGHGIYLSTDNGQNWYQPQTLTNQSVYALAKNSTHIFAGTWGGGIFRSADNGESWESAGLVGKGFWDLLVVGNLLYAASPDFYSRIYYSSDNGTTWNYGSLGYPASDPRGLFYSDGKLFACDMGLWVSTDMGSTWQIQYGLEFDSTGYPINVKMFKSITRYNNYLIASVMAESIYISSDNGVNWIPFNEGIISDWTFADMEVNGSHIWALRDFFGNAYRRPVQDLLMTLDKRENNIDNFILYQNYPNPFNPSTTIEFDLSSKSMVTLKIFNVLGEEVSTLVSEWLPAGSYSYEWDASNLPSGVYLYLLETAGFVETRKMVLIR